MKSDSKVHRIKDLRRAPNQTKLERKLKVTFTACIDEAPATPEYQILQLRQNLSGEAFRVVGTLRRRL